MPSEIRCIIFTKSEFLQAARVYFRRVGEPLTGEVSALSLEQDGRVRLALTRPGAAQGTDLVLDHDRVGSILVFHCIDNKIPLPANSIRRLRIVGGNICLVIAKNIPPAVLEKMTLDVPASG